MKRKTNKKADGLKLRGFFRGQIQDTKGRVIGDSGWVQNAASASGLTALALLVAGSTANQVVTSGLLGTAFNSASTTLGGSANAYKAVNTSTSGTCTATFTCSFAGSDGSLNVGAAALVAANSIMIAGQTFASSAMATNQNFNLTYQLRFATA
jgi:hypothetical protein